MRVLIEINEMDLSEAIKSLDSYREYVKAILVSIETRKGGYDAGEALDLLAKSNRLERARFALAHYQEAQIVGSRTEATCSGGEAMVVEEDPPGAANEALAT